MQTKVDRTGTEYGIMRSYEKSITKQQEQAKMKLKAIGTEENMKEGLNIETKK